MLDKLRILLFVLIGAAGVASSYALAGEGKPHHGALQQTTSPSCQRAHVYATVSAPQRLP